MPEPHGQQVRATSGAGRHIRRYLPFYVFGALWVLMVALVPTVSPSRETAAPQPVGPQLQTGSGSLPPEGQGPGAATGATPPVSAAGGAPAAARPGAPARGATAPAPTGARPTAPAAAQVGKTRGGVDCRPGVRQLPSSAYSLPCVPRWAGPSNSGATYRGVTANSIKVVTRTYADNPNSRAIQAVQEQAGVAKEEDVAKMRKVFLDHFNGVFELYGRKVVIEEFKSTADPIQEVENQGREHACADATAIAQERKAFAVIPGPGGLGYGPFSECAAERQMVVPIGPYGFPESWYRRYHPYAWGIQMNCDRISYEMSEYVGKRLNKRNAKWARDPLYVNQPRRFGVIGPDIAAYRSCGDLFVREVTQKYGVQIASRYIYVLDPATLSSQAAQAVVQFKAAGVTTLVLGSDFLTNINLTQQAAAQGWGPEWVIIGAGFQDYDNYTRLYNQDRIAGHLFGTSQLGATELLTGPQSEPVQLYKRLTGQNPPAGTDGDYFMLLHLFDMLQAAGPNLTPTTLGAGEFSLPPLGPPRLDYGLWSFRTGPDGRPNAGEHTAVDDSREVFWDSKAKSADGGTGAYRATYGGKRFTNGQWPAEEPPVYR